MERHGIRPFASGEDYDRWLGLMSLRPCPSRPILETVELLETVERP